MLPLALMILAASPVPKQVAVLQMQVEGGLDAVIGNQLTARIAETVGKRQGHSVIAPDDIRALLEQESRKQLLGCTEESCLAEIAGALGVEAIVSGRVSKIEGGFAVSLSLVDARGARALAHVNETWRGESIALLELVVPMIDKLFAPKGATLTGTIEIEGAASGSRILIDDQVRGTAPAGQMGGIAIGARRLQVVEEDYEPFERWVVVKSGEISTVAVKQQPIASSAVYEKWWFWTAAAAGVAGAAVGAAVLLGGGSTGGPAGDTGVNVSVNADTAFNGGR
jgi:hypothetical protein